VNADILHAAASQRPQVLYIGPRVSLVLNVVLVLGSEFHLELHTTYPPRSDVHRRLPSDPGRVRVNLRGLDGRWQLAPVHLGSTVGLTSTVDEFAVRVDEIDLGPFDVTVESGGTDGRVVSAPVEVTPLQNLSQQEVSQRGETELDSTADHPQLPAVAGIPERVYRDESFEVLRAPVLALGPQLHAWYLLGTRDPARRLHGGPPPNPPFVHAALVADNHSWLTRFGAGTGSGGESGESYAWEGRRDELGPGPFRIVSTFRRWGGAHTSLPTSLEPLALPKAQ